MIEPARSVPVRETEPERQVRFRSLTALCGGLLAVSVFMPWATTTQRGSMPLYEIPLPGSAALTLSVLLLLAGSITVALALIGRGRPVRRRALIATVNTVSLVGVLWGMGQLGSALTAQGSDAMLGVGPIVASCATVLALAAATAGALWRFSSHRPEYMGQGRAS